MSSTTILLPTDTITHGPSLFVILPIVAVVTWLCVFLNNIRAKHLPLIGPTQLPIIGNSIQLIKNEKRFNKYMIELTEQYGTTFHISLPASAPIIATTDPKNLEYILKTNFDNYPKGQPFIDRLIDFLGHGIFNADGQQWQTQRKTASKIFTMKALRDDMCPIFVEHAQIFIDQIASKANKSTEYIDIQDMFFRYTLDSICLIAFGIDLHCLTANGPVKFAVAFDDCQRILDKRFVTPGWQVFKALQIGEEGTLSKAIQTINEFAYNVIEQRKQMSTDQLEKKTDLLSQFMSMGKDSSGHKFTTDDYKDIVLNFIIAGRDTTAQNLSWMFYELALHPEVEQKVYNEIKSVLSSNNGVATYDICSNQLPYLHNCVVEALRLHPSVPKEMKHAIKDDVLPDGTKVPAGTAVVPLIQALMRRTEVWGPDANKFRPERWDEYETKPDDFMYPAFQAGPRTCLGKHMALLEAKMAASMLLYRYKFTLVQEQIVEEEIAMTLPARYGIKMHVHTRT